MERGTAATGLEGFVHDFCRHLPHHHPAQRGALLQAYLHSLYRSLLGRNPTSAELARWTAAATGEDPGGPDSLPDPLPAPAAPPTGSPFVHYHARFDAEAVIRRHAVPGLTANPRFVTNFLGVLIDPKYCHPHLETVVGTVEPIPIPANWHADIAEWAAALRAVERARDRFTMIELGCGWGCWMNNTGAAARRAGLAVRLIGVEGDPGHVAFARESTAMNGFGSTQVVLHHGIAAATAGTALFLRAGRSGEAYGSQPVFGATAVQLAEALHSGSHDVLPMLPLDEVVANEPRIDLLHVDIQGGEAELVAGTLDVLAAKVAYLLIGTHSRAIEGRLFDTLLGAGWELDIERPALLSLGGDGPQVTVDGVQGWCNPALAH